MECKFCESTNRFIAVDIRQRSRRVVTQEIKAREEDFPMKPLINLNIILK